MRGGVYCYILARQHIVHTVNLQWPNEFHVLLFLRFLIFRLIYTKGEARGWKLGIFFFFGGGGIKFFGAKSGGGKKFLKAGRGMPILLDAIENRRIKYL